MAELKEPKFTDNALTVLKERYLWKDSEGNIIETPKDMLVRVARTVASVEDASERDMWFENFYNIMARLDFLPNSPTLMNAGRSGVHGQLAACYVIDVDDSMEGIFDALKKQALIHKSGGGTGFNFSNLRGSGELVKSTNGKASGPVSFMQMFNLSTDVVQQGGMRRGANMGILNCDHPDVLDFIKAKAEEGKLSNFNISVGMFDYFMDKALTGSEWESYVFEQIVRYAWAKGDPGLVFLDRINDKNTTPHLGELTATNPCGETPLYGGEACNLGSINLANMVKGRGIDWRRLNEAVRYGVRFLDNVIDVNSYPLPEVEEAVKRTRKIGLGVMGWAEMLFQLRIPYNHKAALHLAEIVMSYIQRVGHIESAKLAEKYGSYLAYVENENQPFPLRNATVTCIAPTGTISLLADCSSGIEPLFALEHKRLAFAGGNDEGKELIFRNKYYDAFLKLDWEVEKGKDWNFDGAWIAESVFVTAHDIPPTVHIDMQAAFQKHTDLAVSKTINLPKEASLADVKAAYVQAWQSGCKGITVFRDGCLSTQVLTRVEVDKDKSKCPLCGAEIIMKEGCESCEICGWSKCSV